MKAYLTETRKPRSAYKQELKQQFVGPVGGEVETGFGPNTPWPLKLKQLFIDYKIPAKDRSRMSRLFAALEAKHGTEYMQNIPNNVLRELVRKFSAMYSDQREFQKLARPGVSQLYVNPGTQPFHEPSPEALHRSLEISKIPAVGGLTKDELKQSSHPAVQLIARAVVPEKKLQAKNQALVFDTENRPFYLFVRLHKTHPGAEKVRKGEKRKFEVVIPRELDFRTGSGRKLSETIFEQYTKDTPWLKEMRTEEMVRLMEFTIDEGNFDDKVVAIQTKAWKFAREWYGSWLDYQDLKFKYETLLKKSRENSGEYHPLVGLPENEKQEANKLARLLEIILASLTGDTPSDHYFSNIGPTDRAKLEKYYKEKAKFMPTSYTWYLWLLISEDEYGVRVPERQQMYPQYSRKPSATKGLEQYWSIRPKQAEEGISKWNTQLLRGIGYGMNKWDKFEQDLRAANYEFSKSGSEIQRLWVPLIGNIRNRYGIRLHPANITDYLDSARKRHKALAKTEGILGRVGDKLTVREGLAIPQYIFKEGPVEREFSLIPAAEYEKHFDSPAHGGERLIHGMAYKDENGKRALRPQERFVPPVGKPHKGQPPRRTVLAQMENRRQQQEIAAVENIIQINRVNFLQRAEQLNRIQQRQGDRRWRVKPMPPPHALVHNVEGKWVGRPRRVIHSTYEKTTKHGETLYGQPYKVKSGGQRKFKIIDKGTTFTVPSDVSGGEDKKVQFIARRPLATRPELRPVTQYVPTPPSWIEYWAESLHSLRPEDKKKFQTDARFANELKMFTKRQYDTFVKNFYAAHDKGFIVLNPNKVPENRG